MLLFFILFAITAPVIVLMAKGYRFDRNGRIFVYSGSITVKSWPRDVDVYVDGKKKKKGQISVINNSYTINGVRPGSYKIRVAKDGYNSWEKTVDVHSGVSTEFWNIILFPLQNNETTNHSVSGVEQFFISPREKDEIVFFSSDENGQTVSLLNIADNQHEEIFWTDESNFLPTQKKENIEWSSDNKRILIPLEKEGQLEYTIARIKKEDLQDIVEVRSLFGDYEPTAENETGENEEIKGEEVKEENAEVDKEKSQSTKVEFEKVRWMFDKNNELVVLTKNHELFYVNIEKPEEKILIDTKVSGFDFAGNRIYYSQLPNNIIWEIKDNNISTKRQITSLPVGTDPECFSKLVVYDQYRMAMITPKNEFYLLNEDKEKGEVFLDKLSDDVVDIQFSDDGKKVLFWTDSEIWCYVLRDWEVQPVRTKGEKIFVTRFSQPLQNVQWLDDYENILFSIGDEVKTVELDNRDRVNIVDVHKNDAGDFVERDLIYDKENQLLYLREKTDDSSFGLKSLLLIDKTGFLGI